MNITSAGIGSGLDLESIITAFVTAESVPTEIRLQEKEERINLELSGIGSFKSALSSFQSVVDKLKSADALSEQVLAVSTDDVSITTNGSASNGSFSIDLINRIISKIKDHLSDHDPMNCLIHGDLWSGNVSTSTHEKGILFDCHLYCNNCTVQMSSLAGHHTSELCISF